jgi:hypothetical protein
MKTLILAFCLIFGGFANAHQTPATESLRAVFAKDFDGDGKPDKLIYEVKPWRTDYEGALIITSANGKTLWEDHWPMAKDDLEELIETEGAVTGKKVDLKSWVEKFFEGGLNYGARFEREKLKASDVSHDELLAGFAKHYGVTIAALKKSILSQKTNLVFSYRAEWREDLIVLVYVPSVCGFVCYQRGY